MDGWLVVAVCTHDDYPLALFDNAIDAMSYAASVEGVPEFAVKARGFKPSSWTHNAIAKFVGGRLDCFYKAERVATTESA